MVRILDDYLLLDLLFGLTFDFNVFFSKRLLTISNDLVLEVIKSQRITHHEFGLCLVSPLRFESNGEVTDAVSLDGERRRIRRVDDEIVPVFGVVRSPCYLDVPVSLSVVDNWQVLSHLASCRNVHLKNSLQRFRLNSKDDSESSDIGLGFVADQDISSELVDRVFAYDRKRYFILYRNYLFPHRFPSLSLWTGLFYLFGFFRTSRFVNYRYAFLS